MKGRLVPQKMSLSMFAICYREVSIGWESNALVLTDEPCAFACVEEAFSKGCDHFEEPVRLSDKSIKQQGQHNIPEPIEALQDNIPKPVDNSIRNGDFMVNGFQRQ